MSRSNLKSLLSKNGYVFITSLNCWDKRRTYIVKQIAAFLDYAFAEPDHWTSQVWKRGKWFFICATKNDDIHLILIYNMQEWNSIKVGSNTIDFYGALSLLADNFRKDTRTEKDFP